MTTEESLIEPGFLFSQHSLNTYLRCPRRFLLQYVDRQPWPMPEDQDPRAYQEHLARGRVFHQWLARRQLGLDMEALVAASLDDQLKRWWQAAQSFDWDSLPADFRQAELPVVVPLGDYRLYARYDLVAAESGGAAVIVDWKTLPVRLLDRTLRERVQTRVYLYTLTLAGHLVTGGPPLQPDQVSMRYWFADFPTETCTVGYSGQAFEHDRRFLGELVGQIVGQPREGFACTERVAQCGDCTYRSLCHDDEESAAATGSPQVRKGWLDEDLDFALEIESTPELDY
jgi:hypothetical protein